MSNNSNTSSTVPAVIIKLPILLFKRFNSSRMSNEITSELTEREIPIISEVILLKLNKNLLTKKPVIKGIKVLKIDINEDSLKFFLNAVKFISKPTKKKSRIMPILVMNENIEIISLVKSLLSMKGNPKIIPARIWPITLGS